MPRSGIKHVNCLSTKFTASIIKKEQELIKLFCSLYGAKAGVYFAKNITHERTENHQSCENNKGHQNKNQRIFNKTLAFFFG